MNSDTIRFKKIDAESVSGEDFNSAMESIHCEEGKDDMAGLYVKDKTYTFSRKSLFIIGAVVLIVVMVLFVISAVVGHYTAKRENDHTYRAGNHMNWSGWSRWDTCSVSCGIGTKRRVRTCMLDPEDACIGPNDELRVCVMDECNDDQWSPWGAWSSCTNSTGTCKRSRGRSCHNTALNIGGGRCTTGNSTQEAKCRDRDCFGYSWTDWGTWSACSKHCDFGVQKRERICKDHRGNAVNISNCPGESTLKKWCHNIACEDANECESNPCQNNGVCVDKYKEYECVCPMGWRGDNCEILDHCASSPCVYGNCTSHQQGFNCTCIGATGPRCEVPMGDCVDIRDNGDTRSGIYTLRISTGQHVKVYCDMETDGGGWTVFQYRFDGSVNFYRNFSDYEFGFGDLNGEFWLGLHYIYHLTRDPTELRIDLSAADTSDGYETFQSFSISSAPYYTLSVSSPGGSISPAYKGLTYNDGESFSTFDEERSGNNCAEKDHGGWWFDNCAYANLNGYYGTPGSTVGYNGRQEAAMTYRSFKGYESLLTSKMMIRRK